MTEQDEIDLVAQFSEITNSSLATARTYLSSNNWELEGAVTAYMADREEAAAAKAQQSGPRRLDGQPVEASSSSAPVARTAARPAPRKTGIATLSSLGGGGHAHDDDDDDDDENDDYSRGDLFAGGEKSGLAVQDPSENGAKKLIDDIVKKARANATRPETQEAAPPRFRGTARTLGGDGVESRIIPDPLGDPEPRESSNNEPQSRTLYLWRNGFSIDDGPLHRFDDPQNAADLVLIRQGRAPLHLMNVSYDQPVDVKLEQRDENWHQLPRIYRPFGGTGRRLGAPTPGSPSVVAALEAAGIPTAPEPSTQPTTIDESQPVITIRIQLPNGTRLPMRFNATHTIGDVYTAVRQSLEMTSRQWVVATTFPSKDHTDHSVVLGDTPEFRRGGTAVVKWA